METCYLRVSDGWEEVEFMGMYTKFDMQQGYQYSSMVAIIKLFVIQDGVINGYINEVDFRALKFVKQGDVKDGNLLC